MLGMAVGTSAASDVTGHVYVNDNTAGNNTTGGFEPVSIAARGHLVYVANEGNKVTGTGSNYTGFTLNAGGHLTPLSGSTISLPSTANPGDILFNSTGTSLIGVEVGTSDPSTFLIDSFVVGRDGRLTAAPGSPFAAQA